MESCYAVEKELEKLLSKFSYTDKHTANSLQELLTYVDGVKRELIEGQLFSSLVGLLLILVFLLGIVFCHVIKVLLLSWFQPSVLFNFNLLTDRDGKIVCCFASSSQSCIKYSTNKYQYQYCV